MTKSAKRKAHDADKRASSVDVPALPTSTLDRLPQVPLVAPYAPIIVGDLDLAFPASVIALMPAYETIPRDLPHRDLFAAWFYRGLKSLQPTLRDPSMDARACIRHISCVLGSYEPKHEHKKAAVRFLLDRWFSSVVWEAES